MDKVYFGNNGLTSTSANYISNKAKEYVETLNEKLDSISFLDGRISLVGGQFTPTQSGVKTLDWINKALDTKTEAYSLIAWLREAIKAKNAALKEIETMPIELWCKENNKEYPEQVPNPEFLTEQDILDTWSIKDRNRYLELSTKVSVYGKFIHPNGAYSDAKKTLKEKLNDPVSYQESGRDTIIRKYTPSIDYNTVDTKFFELTSEWRKAQAELNSYKHKIQIAIDEDKASKTKAFVEARKLRLEKLESLGSEFKEWSDNVIRERSNLKIIIPDHLRTIYEKINNL